MVRGGDSLRGRVVISGYKHALTVIVAAAVAQGLRVTLRNVPDTTETRVLWRILEELGAVGTLEGGVWDLDTTTMRSAVVPVDLSTRIHGSLYLAPALLARFGEVSLGRTGGDRIGPVELGGGRPIGQVAAVLERFGARVSTREGIRASARRLRGCAIDVMEFSSHPDRLRGPQTSSATKTALILAGAAERASFLRNPVVGGATRELCDFLRACGGEVREEADSWCIQTGASSRHVVHEIISDGTEIATFIAAVAHAGGSLLLTGITEQRTRVAMADELNAVAEMGVSLSWTRTGLHVRSTGRLRPLQLVIECNGFSTDAHPLLAVPLLRAEGVSRITDHVWTNRLAYVDLLAQMGARTRISGPTVELWPSRLHPPEERLLPGDSRAAAAAVVAALGVAGTSRIVDEDDHLGRSYERLASKLRSVGATVDEA